jgi:hypothetical protein
MAYDKSDKTGVGPDRNPDPITGAPGSHPTGVGIGAAAGGAAGVGAAIAAGAVAGSVVGPVGTAIGAIIGAVAGGYAGKAIGEANDPTEDDTYWRSEHVNRPYYKSDYDYDRDLSPAYRYGSTIGRNVNDTYPDITQRDVPTSGTAATAGVGERISDAASNVGHKVADAGRSVKESVKDAIGSDRTDDDRSYDRYETDIRSNWDKVRGKSSLEYDQARDAIRDAYNRRIAMREGTGGTPNNV